MTAERFRQIRNVFEAALDRSGADRALWLAQACQGDSGLGQEVAALLAQSERRSGVIDSPAVELLAGPYESQSRWEGRRIGAWEILRELGRGGMAVVYLARRGDRAFHMQAAVKIVQTGLPSRELLDRFRQEREILAQLDHPNIARLLDGGTTPEGLPYLVMEYVDGEPLTQYCDGRRLPTEERLRLFADLCKAVSYLHEHAIIHRDLKPSNILVSKEGVLKLLDFGIAKLMESSDERTLLMTRSGLQLLTPEYASPEQVRGERVMAQTDIYALGVILYELLTGQRPYRIQSRVMHEIVRAICEEEPERPSSVVTHSRERLDGTLILPDTTSRARQSSPENLSRALRGDLDDIVLKALRKTPAARYRTAQQFEEDIAAHLEGKRVLAHHDSWLTRAYKGGIHHRGVVAVAFIVLVLLASGGVSVNPRALLYAAGAFGLVGVWYAATDRTVGRRLADGGPFHQSWSLVILCVAISAIALLFPERYGIWVPTIVYSGLATYMLVRSVAWMSRNRWAGQLVLDASGARNRTALGSFNMVYLGSAIVNLFQHHRHSPIEAIVRAVALAVVGICIYVLDRRVEFRDRGIVSMGRLIPWDEIEAWEWESAAESLQFLFRAAGAEAIVLKIERRRAVHFLPPVRVRVSPVKVDDVTRVMERYLSEWPELAVNSGRDASLR
ncbi:MAG: serine/threonine-protein kinase [Bryobacteraceae bacterium]